MHEVKKPKAQISRLLTAEQAAMVTRLYLVDGLQPAEIARELGGGLNNDAVSKWLTRHGLAARRADLRARAIAQVERSAQRAVEAEIAQVHESAALTARLGIERVQVTMQKGDAFSLNASAGALSKLVDTYRKVRGVDQLATQQSGARLLVVTPVDQSIIDIESQPVEQQSDAATVDYIE